MNPIMSNGSFDPHVAPKRSNSGREIIYVQNQRVIGSHQQVHDYNPHSSLSIANQGIPADVVEAFDRLRGYSYRELCHWLKLDRHNGKQWRHELGSQPPSDPDSAEIKHTSFRNSSLPSDHRLGHNQRLSIASQSSGGSSVFSAAQHRMSIASSNTSYSQFSDSSPVNQINFAVPSHAPPPIPQQTSEVTLNRKKSTSLLGGSPTKTASRNTLTQPVPRPSPRQSQSELEAKKKYFCTSCNKGFARKYDWKVHEQRYHEQQKQYPCPDCNVVLHAETLFKSHHRDAHGCQDCPHAKSQEREVDTRRRRTAWGCGFCGEFLDEWEKRCDHVSAHYDEGLKRDSWDHSKVIVGLLKQEDIDELWRALLIEKHGQVPNPPLALRWSKDATGRSHGENSQQLQDLLEFGACPRDAAAIAQMAYDLGIRTNVEGVTPVRAVSETEPSPLEKTEPQQELNDSLMASPTTITPDAPIQFVNPQIAYDVPTNTMTQQQSDSRMSSVGPSPMSMTWNAFPEHHGLPVFQQPNFQQPMHPLSVSYNKELPPIPCDASEHSVTLHSQLGDDPTHHMNFENWSLMGSTIAEEGMMGSAGFAPQQHFAQ
jgi:hypothetical protein